MNPAPASSTIVSTISVTMSTPVHRRAQSPPVPPRPPSWRTLVDVPLRGVQRGCQTEDDPGGQTDRRHEGDDGPVHREFHVVRHADILHRRVGPPHARHRHAHICEAGDEREQDALHQQLPDNTPTAGAQRDAHRDLVLAMRRAGEQEVGDVRAGDQQHEGHGALKQEEKQAELPPVDRRPSTRWTATRTASGSHRSPAAVGRDAG